MVIDTSALMTILFGEPDRLKYAEALEKAPLRLISAVNALEAAMVVQSRKGPVGGRELDLLLHRAKIDIVHFDSAMAEEARRTWREFGKGNHPAGLNFCDCCALALTRISGQPLLFKGDDFVRANAPSALAPASA
jgi:ribonuclease VapC